MKIYEIGDNNFEIWVATDRYIEIVSKDNKDLYITELPFVDEDTPGIDLVIK